jgi:hypothetical protein
MLPQEYFEKEQEARKLAQKLCKLNSFRIIGGYNKEKEAHIYDIEVTGCKNERRHGSAYCQACSDAYHAQISS